eukprot:m.265357 g.265357  ORF g.265357 m.265357 type:complete len:71 (+) comp61393_c0_seq1:1212-1424(+)
MIGITKSLHKRCDVAIKSRIIEKPRNCRSGHCTNSKHGDVDRLEHKNHDSRLMDASTSFLETILADSSHL